MEIALHSRKYPGLVAIIDDDDEGLVSGHCWYPQKNGLVFYAVTTINKRRVSMHRLILGAGAKETVDHKDGDGLNNQRSNIRLCTVAQNVRNRRKSSLARSSRFKGVAYAPSKSSGIRTRKRNPWEARIWVGGRNKSLGRYSTEEDAARAYDRAAIEHFGEFARTNFLRL